MIEYFLLTKQSKKMGPTTNINAVNISEKVQKRS
jgi:hypothetical protein